MAHLITKMLKSLWKGFKIIIVILSAMVSVSAFLQVSVLGGIALISVVEKSSFVFFIPLLIVLFFLWAILLRLLAMFFASMIRFLG